MNPAPEPTPPPAESPATPPASRPPADALGRFVAGHTGLLLALVLLLSFGVFAPTCLNGFTLDDPHYARVRNASGDRNPMVAELRPLAEYWQKPMNHGLPSQCRGYRPVTVYSYALANAAAFDPLGTDRDQRSGESTAWVHHLGNLALHVLATALVFLLCRALAGTGPALVAALVFGVHALHSGPVAAIVGRAELLTFTLGGGAMLLYTAAHHREGSGRWWRLGIAGALAWLAFGAKESGVAWAVFIPLFAAVRGVGLRRQRVSALVCLGVPLLLFLWLRSEVLATHIAPRGTFWVEHDANPLYSKAPVQRIASATPILLYGLGKVLWPCYLSSNYGDGPFAVLHGVADWRFLLSAALLGALLVGAVLPRTRARHPLLFLAAAAFFGFSFITSNIPFPIETIFAERLLYTPVLGAALLGAWFARHLPARHRWLGAGALLSFVAHNAWLSVERSIAWHDNHSLIASDLRSQPRSVGLHLDMGNQHLWNFDRSGAVAEFRAALAIDPESPRALRLLAEHSDPDTARELLERGLRSPHLVPATEGRRLHWALARLHERAGRRGQAWQEYERALACNPWVPDIRLHMLRECALRGEWDRFERLLRDGLGLLPDDPYLAMNRGVLLHHRGRFAAAAEVLQEVLPGLPDQVQVVEAWIRLADCHLRTGRAAEARSIAERLAGTERQVPSIQAERRRILAATEAARVPR